MALSEPPDDVLAGAVLLGLLFEPGELGVLEEDDSFFASDVADAGDGAGDESTPLLFA